LLQATLLRRAVGWLKTASMNGLFIGRMRKL
jgi:hypothetical protein